MSELVSSTKSHLKRIVPNAKEIVVKVERDHHFYRTKIHVQIPGTVLHAVKVADTVSESLDLSYHAILKQIDRIKTRRFKTAKMKMVS